MLSEWKVSFSREAAKQYEKLKKSGSKKPSIIDAIDFFALELKHSGPYLKTWPNYGPLGREKFHCHLRKGKPTYVACWQILDAKQKLIEVYYVGTHEAAPY
jgi:hypothetical protein